MEITFCSHALLSESVYLCAFDGDLVGQRGVYYHLLHHLTTAKNHALGSRCALSDMEHSAFTKYAILKQSQVLYDHAVFQENLTVRQSLTVQ